MTYPDSRVVNYDYGTGAGNELSRILKLKIGTTEIVDYSYLGLNQVVIQKYTEPSTPVEYTLATGTGNDPYDGLDRFGRIIKLLWQKGTTKLVDYEYAYDRVGNRLTQDVKHLLVIKHVDELYEYDGLYRLTDYDRGQLQSGSISNPNLTQDWTLDQTGNWNKFQQGVTGILNQTRSQNTTNEITNITKTVGVDWPTPAHDDNGNMTSFPQPNSLTNSFDATWDAWNRLVKLKDGSDTVAEFEYDGLGRRTIKKYYKQGSLSETRHFYFSTSSQVLEERVDTDTDPAQQFLWGIRYVDDLILRDKDTTGNGTLNERLYAMSDPRFSILAIADNTGVIKERYAYDGYGRSDVFAPNFKSRESSSFAWEYRYTGRQLDLETAIYYFRARYYHAELGRFISRDSIGYFDGMNLYRAYFVPNRVDPRGTDLVPIDIPFDDGDQPVECTPEMKLFGLCPIPPIGFPLTPLVPTPPCERNIGISFSSDFETGLASVYTSILGDIDCHVSLDPQNPNWSKVISDLKNCIGNCCIRNIVMTGHGVEGGIGPINVGAIGTDSNIEKFLDDIKGMVCKTGSPRPTCTLKSCCTGSGTRGRQFVCKFANRTGTVVHAWDDIYAVNPFGNEVIADPFTGELTVTGNRPKWSGTWRSWCQDNIWEGGFFK